jgi:6-phosphogluconolactonase
MKRAWLYLWQLMLALLVSVQPTQASEALVFVTSFAPADKGAIQALRLDLDSGRLEPLGRTPCANPFYIALSSDGRRLYATQAKQFGGKEDEQVAAYSVDRSAGTLTLLNQQSARGSAACYLAVDATGSAVLVANYTSGSVAALPVHKDGSLGPASSFVQHEGSSVHPTRQKAPHAHCFVISPDNRFAFAADLGLDQVLCYQLQPQTAKLSPARQPFARTPPGAGPRHLTFHPNGKHVYVINELSNSITLYDYDGGGGLIEKQTISTLPQDFTGTSYCADVKATPCGRYLFGTNRGHDSIAVYRLADDGRLARLANVPSGGKGPQNLALAADGKLLLCANMPGNNVTVFRIGAEPDVLTAIGAHAVTSPSCIQLLPPRMP